jgi:hypothetical protein
MHKTSVAQFDVTKLTSSIKKTFDTFLMSKSLPPAKSPYSPRSPSRSLKEPARYGDDLRPSPLKEPRRSPVVKLGTSAGDFNVPGPGTYSASMDSYKNTPPSWTMGDKKARKSSLGGSSDSPGPVYMLRGSVTEQVSAAMPSCPRYGFGTTPRKLGSTEESCAPGPGAYSPRVTNKASIHEMQTVSTGQLTASTTPRTSTQMTEGTWSRNGANRQLGQINPGPGSETYTPLIGFTKTRPPEYTVYASERTTQMGDTPANNPGPLGYNPAYKSRFGRGHFGDSPRPIICGKNEASALKRYISPVHCKVFYGRGSPSPDTYTPLEQMGITDYTISNTSTHSPRYTFGTEIRPCAA